MKEYDINDLKEMSELFEKIEEELGVRGKTYDAVITDAVKHVNPGWSNISGFIVGDAKKRFSNWEFIQTSTIVNEEDMGKYSIVKTRNSEYKVYYK